MTYAINLVNWRAVQKKQQQRCLWRESLFIGCLFLVVISVAQLGLQFKLNKLQHQTQQLHSQIQQNHQQFQYLLYLQQQYQQQRSIFLLLQQLARPRPAGIYIFTLKQQNQMLELSGYAQQPEVVQAWLRQLTSQPALQQLRVQLLQQDEAHTPYIENFNIAGVIS